MIREHLQVLNSLIETHVIGYSCSLITYVKMPFARRQYAWLGKENYSDYKLEHLNSINLTINIRSSKRFYTAKGIQRDNKLNPWFVTGLIDGEGCFFLNIYLAKAYNTGWTIKPSFKLALNIKDIALLEEIKNFFGVGKIYKQRVDSLEYRVQNLKDLEILMSHFDKYPLFTQKQSDYELFRKVIHLMLDKKHLTKVGLLQILSIKAAINWGLPDKIKLAFPEIIPVERPLVTTKYIEDSSWLAGFTSGEGCFLCTIYKSNTKIGESVLLRFIITQHSKDEQLMRNIMQYFGCGNLYKSREKVLDFVVSKLSDINNNIIPFFSKYPIEGEKYKDFMYFCKIVELMNNKAHLTKEGLNEIRNIKLLMNRRNSSSSTYNTDISPISTSDHISLDTSDNLTNSLKDVVIESDIDISSRGNSGNSSTRKLHLKEIDPKAQWEPKLVGLTDSDDFNSFSVEKLKDSFVLRYSIFQPLYNLRLLYFIKKTLGYGKVLKLEDRKLARFIISDNKVLKEKLFPIFDKYPLLSSKYFYYLRFKEAWDILENKSLTIEQKNEELEKLLKIALPNDYVSPAICHSSDISSRLRHKTIKSVVNYWSVGFIEGKGNLIVLYENGVFNLEFSICINRDKVLLNLIKRLLHIPNEVIIEGEKGWLLKTNNSRAISNIINFYSSKGCKFKGMKALSFKLWSRAFMTKDNLKKISKIKQILDRTERKLKY
jgi:LAGLIDADG endonuclease